VIFFSLSFVIVFLAAACLRFIELRVEWAKNLPPKPETSLTLLITAAHWALTTALFSTIIIASNYSVRKGYFALMSVGFVMALSLVFCIGISTVLDQWKAVPPAQTTGIPLGSNGMILSNSLNRNETAVVLLRGSAEPFGPRVVAIPEQPLSFQENAAVNFDLPLVPFADDTPYFLKSLSIDIRLNAEMFQRKFSEGFSSYFVYVGSMIFLLCSLGFAIKFSTWPLANLFIAVLAFRGVLMLETFLITPEMQEIIGSFLGNKLSVNLAIPLLFLSFGMLLFLYSFLVFVLKRRKDDEY